MHQITARELLRGLSLFVAHKNNRIFIRYNLLHLIFHFLIKICSYIPQGSFDQKDIFLKDHRTRDIFIEDILSEGHYAKDQYQKDILQKDVCCCYR
jgi:hypothetical protein